MAANGYSRTVTAARGQYRTSTKDLRQAKRNDSGRRAVAFYVLITTAEAAANGKSPPEASKGTRFGVGATGLQDTLFFRFRAHASKQQKYDIILLMLVRG